MMDITKSREDFETWFKSEFIIPASHLTLSPETFKNVVQKAYQSGRESIEVDIPEEMTCREALEQGYTSDYANGFTAAIIQCYATLRTAGIRIKGESE
ncbi:hypothetical protein [Yersinia frederiksenii]|uniref:hypothetical protein n=1 Tax=Yersinia frederiksenii TaxID=29484 RepID=UPI0005DD72D6|nr:hypothetical protein [Yersinia frederiksenii]CFR14813.1 Uncharacterised protein [Yersinia frederiksenii]